MRISRFAGRFLRTVLCSRAPETVIIHARRGALFFCQIIRLFLQKPVDLRRAAGASRLQLAAGGKERRRFRFLRQERVADHRRRQIAGVAPEGRVLPASALRVAEQQVQKQVQRAALRRIAPGAELPFQKSRCEARGFPVRPGRLHRRDPAPQLPERQRQRGKPLIKLAPHDRKDLFRRRHAPASRFFFILSGFLKIAIRHFSSLLSDARLLYYMGS